MNKEFSKIRSILFPIHKSELKIFLPMVIMMFSFLLNYTIMRDTKDTLILTQAGAEAIPFLKFWGTLPMSIVFLIIYTKLSNRLTPKTLFYTIILPFILFFGSFGFILYPYREFLQPNSAADALRVFITHNLPIGSHHTLLMLTEVFRNWIYAVFYVLSELWGSMGVSLLFWQFANQIFPTSKAKRFYPRITQLGNLSLIASGFSIIYFSDIRQFVPAGVDPWGITLKWLMSSLVIF